MVSRGEDELLPFLADSLVHFNGHLRSAAARVLVHMGDDSILFHFIDALVDPAHNVSQLAAWAILAFDDSPPLVRHMQRCLRRQHGDESLVNIDSIEALAQLGDERAIPCLIEALNAGDDRVFEAALKALGTFGVECDENTPIESLRQAWRSRKDNLSGPAVNGGAMMDHRGGEKLYHLAPLFSIDVSANCRGKMSGADVFSGGSKVILKQVCRSV